MPAKRRAAAPRLAGRAVYQPVERADGAAQVLEERRPEAPHQPAVPVACLSRAAPMASTGWQRWQGWHCWRGGNGPLRLRHAEHGELRSHHRLFHLVRAVVGLGRLFGRRRCVRRRHRARHSDWEPSHHRHGRRLRPRLHPVVHLLSTLAAYAASRLPLAGRRRTQRRRTPSTSRSRRTPTIRGSRAQWTARAAARPLRASIPMECASRRACRSCFRRRRPSYLGPR